MTILVLYFLFLCTRIQAILNGLNGTSSGWQVYPNGSYHYGPSIMIDDSKNNLIHMWTCSPGTGSTQWDVIRYHYSNDYGKTWSPDEIALKPTPGSLDTYSACDPSVVKINNYYYIGYTSTINPNATQNQLFLARSLTPNGNYEKWNGTGWNSSSPQPIVAYLGPSIKYGIGEPSLVLIDNLIYVYYTNSDDTGSYTDLAIAQLNSTNQDTWPLYLQYKGHVIYRRVSLGEDSTDIKWCPQLQLFIGVTTINRFSSQATVGVYQSLDRYGLQFQSTPYIGQRVQQGAHNIGISGSTAGWFQLENQYHFVSYAYQSDGSSWGNWPTYLTPVQIVQLPLGTVIDGIVSSNMNWSISSPFVWDHNLTTYWSSQSANNEFVTINLGTVLSIKTLSLVPRMMGYGFPIDFSVQASNDSQNFIHILDQHYSNLTSIVNCFFMIPVLARYFQVVPVTYGVDEHGTKLLQVAEIYVQTN
ncbi:hypothetical protein I4U23_010435 [Adineta vaga]|nr:hypothetical protein I4U23_010435 [Adineta vaga]